MGLRIAIAAALAAATAAAFGAPATAASINAQAKAKVVKPLTIQSVQDLDLGTVMLATGTWSGATVQLSQSGALTCSAPLTCSGTTQVAMYNVTGSKGQTVNIDVPDLTLVNQSNPAATLKLVPDSPATITLTNSGKAGTTFSIGGAISLNSTTAAGTYTGTFNVTADYQ